MTHVLGHQPINHRDQSLIPGQSMMDLWWMNWHCERFPSTSVLPPSVSFDQYSILIHLSITDTMLSWHLTALLNNTL